MGSGQKNATNVRRHGVAFRDAARIFDGPTVECTDDRYDYGEVRIYAIGLVNGIEITVIYTDRDPDERRIIYRPGGRSLMSDDISGTTSKTEPQTDWRRIRSMTDAEIRAAIIDDPDAKPTDENFWKDARLAAPRRKVTVTMRVDADLLEWFRRERGYQARINEILRAHMNAQLGDHASTTMTRTAAPSSVYKLFEQAMISRKQIRCTYNGRSRELCPVILGHSQGQEKALTYQFGGQSEKGLPPGGQWRCLWLSKVSNVRLRDGPLYAGDRHDQPQGCVEIVDLDVNPESPYNPRRRLPDAS